MRVVVDWQSIGIIFLILLGFALLFRVFIYAMHAVAAKKFKDGKYKKALGIYLVLRKLNILPTMSKQVYSLQIALIYLLQDNEVKFRQEIEIVKHTKLLAVKGFWLTFIMLSKGQIDWAKDEYARFLTAPKIMARQLKPHEFYDTCLTSVFDYCAGNVESAKEKIDKIYSQLNNPLLIDFYKELLRTMDLSKE